MKFVRPYSLKGKLLCLGIRLLCIPVLLLKGKQWERSREFEENPRTMTFSDIIYFAYKYYFRSPLKPSDDAVIEHFKHRPVHRAEFKDVLVTVSIGGDLMPYEMIKAPSTAELWDEVGADFFGSDLVFANLETPLHTGKASSYVPEVMLNNMYFNTSKETFEIFNGGGTYKGYDVLSIANNHTLDQGYEGIDSTIDFLNHAGIASVGARQSNDEPNFVLKTIHGITIGFVAFTYSLNEFETDEPRQWKVNLLPLNTENCPLDNVKDAIHACRDAGADLVVCSLHCGNAYQAYPSAQTVNLYQRIFSQCGPDVIAGGHPHNLQPWRSYAFTDPITGKAKQGFAIYSLADFVAYDIYTWCHLCAYVKLEIGRDSSGQVVFAPVVKPLVMQRVNNALRLVYAERVLRETPLSGELEDIKVLYNICTGHARD